MAKPISEETIQAAKAAFMFLSKAAHPSLFQTWNLALGRAITSCVPGSEEAYNWLLQNIRSPRGASFAAKGVQYTRFIAVETSKSRLKAFQARAMAAVQAGDCIALLWRLANDTDIAKGDLLASIAIERIGGRNLRYLFPLPGSINEDGQTYTLKRFDPECISRPTQFKSEKEPKKQLADPTERRGEELVDVLAAYGIECKLASMTKGPTVTTYEITPKRGTPGSKVSDRVDDIAREMSAPSAFVMPSTGHNTIGIQIPNQMRETVLFSALLDSDAYRNGGVLPLILGKDVSGSPLVVDLQKMPHLMIAGTTGSGKSVGVKTMLMSLALRYSPAELGFVMLDPKRVELTAFRGLPHLVSPVVTNPDRAVQALQWVLGEMTARYDAMERVGVDNIAAYNARVPARERTAYLIVVIDEFADLMMTASDAIEGAVQRIAQFARAAGIHLIMATQRPSVDVVTGVIKANMPTRLSYRVLAPQDSVTILVKKGAEQLLGEGDGFLLEAGGRLVRLQGAFITAEEIRERIAHMRQGPVRDLIFGALPGQPQRRIALAAPQNAIVETPRDRVIRELRDNEIMTTRDLTDFAGVTRQQLYRMEEAGLIMGIGSSTETRWRLVD